MVRAFSLKRIAVAGFLMALSLPLLATPKPGQFFTSGPAKEKKITLTFDDGPGPETDQVLDLLKKHNVRATFFMLGEQAGLRPKVAERVVKDGHEAASHTYSHRNYAKRYKELGGKDNPKAEAQVRAELEADMARTRTIIEKSTGEKIQLCRMPHGIDRPWVNQVAAKTGFIMVNWTYGADWLSTPEDQLMKSYVKAIKPGAIFLFHDGGRRRQKTINLAEAVIKAAKEQGYEIVTTGELLGVSSSR